MNEPARAADPAARQAPPSNLRALLLQRLLEDSFRFQRHNTDLLRFPAPWPRRVAQWFAEVALGLANRAGFSRRHFGRSTTTARLAWLASQMEELQRLHAALEDEASRALLVELIALRILGPRHVRLSTNDAALARHLRCLPGMRPRGRDRIRTPSGWSLDRYRFTGRDGRIELYCHALNILNTFLLEQYAYSRDQQTVEVRQGDVVIDGGGCWGDSALYFADRVGDAGSVHCFEFADDNLTVLDTNLELNPHLASRVRVVNRALWDTAGEALRYVPNGPGTRTDDHVEGTAEAPTVSIDRYVASLRLKRVDFIKLDVEGAELRVLHGARETLNRFRPTLAVAVYHREEDFVTIPRWLCELGLGYRFYLGHYTIHEEETILFAQVPDRQRGPAPARVMEPAGGSRGPDGD